MRVCKWRLDFHFSSSLSSLYKYCSRGGLLVTTGCSVRPLHITLQISSSQGQGGEEGRGNGVPLFSNSQRQYFTATRSGSLSLTRCVESELGVWESRLICFLSWPEKAPTQKLLRLTNADTKPPLFLPSNRKWEAWHVFHIAAFYGGWECFKITHPITQGPLEMIIPVDDCGLRSGRSNPRWRANICFILVNTIYVK